MLTALILVAAATFAALVIRRLKLDIDQENEFRSKLSTVPHKVLQQS